MQVAATSGCRTETAYEWFQRSQRARVAHSAAPPKDPTAAAWTFSRPSSTTGGTGLAFVDAALRRDNVHNLPVVDVRGASGTGKTWTMVSLAARFAVATRPSQFVLRPRPNHDGYEDDADDDADGSQQQPLPQVIVLDSQYNLTLSKLTYAVRSMLLRRMSSSETMTTQDNEEEMQDHAVQFERDMQDCLRRIQIAHSADLAGWVPILEAMRHHLAQTASDHPTLILWDGFLSEPQAVHEAARMEVIRQLERLLLDCSVLLVTTTTTQENQYRGSSSGGSNRREWERFITHRIRLDRNQGGTNNNNNNHEYFATVHGAQIPFSISMAGILS